MGTLLGGCNPASTLLTPEIHKGGCFAVEVGLETVGMQVWSFCNKVISLETFSDSDDTGLVLYAFRAVGGER